MTSRRAALAAACLLLGPRTAAWAGGDLTENQTDNGSAAGPWAARGNGSTLLGATGAAGYSQEDAVAFAYLATASYCGGSGISSWSCGLPCQQCPGMLNVKEVSNNNLGVFAYVGRWRDQCVLAFRGTSSLEGWAENLHSATSLTPLVGCSYGGRVCQVGSGFLDQYRSIAPGIRSSLAGIGCGTSQPLAVTGHSLGGAMTTLALWDLRQSGQQIAKAYTFGSPRVGDATFAAAFDQAMSGLPSFRVTRGDDPFVSMPQENPFHHVATEVYYPGGSAQGYYVCNGSGEDPAGADRNSPGEVSLLLLQCLVPYACGHLLYLSGMKQGLMSVMGCQAQSGPFFP